MASDLQTLSHLERLQGKRVLLRLDVNSPLEKTSRGTLAVADDTRLRDAIPAIRRLQQAGARIVVMAHLGDPDGKVVKELRMQPIVKRLRELLSDTRHVIHSVTHWDFRRLRADIERLDPGDVLVLENLRFEAGEEANDAAFAKKIASLGDIYVNEAFSVSHRNHASVVAICAELPHYAGWRLAEEVRVLEKVRTKAKKPLVLMVGGAKVHDKIGMMVALAPKATTILVGGIIANTILKIQKIGIGKSKTDSDPPIDALKTLLKVTTKVGRRSDQPLVLVPVDVVVAKSPTSRPAVVDLSAGERVSEGDTIYDIGPKTIRQFAAVLKGAQTIIWNGPMGLIEVPRYRHGSVALARTIATRARGNAFVVAGGGESLEVIGDANLADDIDFCSTGGGAMLKFLSGEKLPGIEALLK